MLIFMLQMNDQIDGSAGKNNNVNACFKTIIFWLFNVSTIFTSLLLPVNFNLQGTCISYPSTNLTGFPVITTSQRLYLSASALNSCDEVTRCSSWQMSCYTIILLYTDCVLTFLTNGNKHQVLIDQKYTKPCALSLEILSPSKLCLERLIMLH